MPAGRHEQDRGDHVMGERLVKRFRLMRRVDLSGSSGTGHVADGVQFTDGVCVMRWLTADRSTCVYDSIEALIRIHGHSGASEVEWVDR